MTYDKMDWHRDSNFPADLPPENGGTHIGMFLAWIILNDLVGQELLEDFTGQLAAVRARSMTGRDFLIELCDERLWTREMNEGANRFAEAYYASDAYLGDYDEVLGNGLETLYHVEDSWENYDKIASRISQRYHAFLRTGSVSLT